LRGVVFTAMAKQTGKPRVILIVVLELRVISLRHKKAQKAQKYSKNRHHFAGL
jgi:uncharacterized DUF497 family protein